MPPELQATFPTEAAAEATLHQLAAAGINPSSLTLTRHTANREGSFLTRLVLTIALWSIAGALIGVGLGAIIWLLLGPEGETGFIIQAVVWGIFGHLLGGLWAGYLLLADRTEQDLPHNRPGGPTTLIVRCPDDAARELAVGVLTSSGATIDTDVAAASRVS